MKPFSDYTPERAIIIYRNEVNNIHLRTHDLHIQNNRPVLGEGRSMSDDAIKTLIVDLGKNVIAQRGGLLPKRILSVRPNGDILWWVKAARRQLNVHERLGIKSGMAPFPTLLFALKDSTLKAFALKTKGTPTEKTRLYRLPLWNLMGDHGGMCMGSADFKTEGTYREIIEKAENGFFNSLFSHANEFACKSGSISKMWAELVGTDKPFPKDELLPCGYHNVGEFMKASGF